MEAAANTTTSVVSATAAPTPSVSIASSRQASFFIMVLLLSRFSGNLYLQRARIYAPLCTKKRETVGALL